MAGFTLVGLPDAALSEARDRVRAALLCSGEDFPARRLTVGLSPAALPKRGSQFDLAIAVSVLGAAGSLPLDDFADVVFLGELGLDGRLRHVRGILPMVLAAGAGGVRRVVVPEADVAEAGLVPDVAVLGARSLRQVLARLRGEPIPDEPVDPQPLVPPDDDPLDLADVLGQPQARRAVEIAAAGHHHLALEGPPGAGKTMLACRLPGILPDLGRAEALEVTAIHSVAGILPPGRPLITRPPFADPHHTASVPAIVGGGSRVLRPGAASLAHRGVLFLDEAPEFQPSVLEALRQPLEHGEIVVSRVEATERFPARFLLVLAANPCPCGHHGSARVACQCTPLAVRRYEQRISAPIRDRIDLWVAVAELSRTDLVVDLAPEPSAVVAARVAEARDRQSRRLGGTPWRVNGEIPGPELRRSFRLAPDAAYRLERSLRRGEITARGADRVARVAWTLADLAGRDRPGLTEVEEALSQRMGRAVA